MYNNIIADKKFRELEITFRIIGEITFPVFSSYSEFICILFKKKFGYSRKCVLVDVDEMSLIKSYSNYMLSYVTVFLTDVSLKKQIEILPTRNISCMV